VKRFLPSPLLSAGLLALWLLLAQSTSLGHWLLGTVLAVAMPLLMSPLRPTPGRLRHPLAAARLVAHVATDVMVSALAVAHGVLSARRRPPRGAFVVVPLELRDAHALAALSMITAVVPGTVWCELAADRSRLLLHVFDMDDETVFIARYKARYEQPLQEIFE
jgi:multicomponent K+:H+ antiporter subunit E